MSKPLKVWSGSEWVNVSSFVSGTATGDVLTEAAAASAYFRISSSVSNFGTIKTFPVTEDIVADLITDELTLVAENGIVLTGTASADTLTISTNGTHLNSGSALVMRDIYQSFDITRIDFDVDHPVGFIEPGQLQWNSEEGTLDLGMSGSSIQSIGMEFYLPPTKNNSGELIPNGAVVMATGAQGDRITIAKAVTDGSIGPEYIVGVATQDIPDGSEYGLVTSDGIVRDINTASYSVGTILYPDPTNPGGWTSSKPTAPAIKTAIAIVLRQQENTGRIYVRMDNGSVLGGTDSNVEFTTLLNNDIITYSQSSSYWTNQGLASAIQEVDGDGSGIDADLLDGQHASYFLNTSSAVQETWGAFTFHDSVTIGNLYVTGSTVFLSTTDLSITDALIYLADSQFDEDVLDIGIFGAYGDANPGHHHAGLVRDASDGIWKLFSNAGEPSNNLVDFSSVDFDTLKLGGLQVTSGNVQFSSSANGIVLKSPNNTSYLITVADDGSLTTEAI